MISHVLLFGPPGAGKGTVGNNLSQALGVETISTGDVLRRSQDAELLAALARGEHADDDLVARLAEAELSLRPRIRIWDGYPRKYIQIEPHARILARHNGQLRTVVVLDVADDAILWQRSQTRAEELARQGRPPRPEDTDHTAFLSRMARYRADAAPMLAHYGAQGIVHTVDATQEPASVLTEVSALLPPLR